VLDINGKHTGALIHLGIVFGWQGDFDQANMLIKKAYNHDDLLKDGFARLGWIKAERYDWAGALEIMKIDLKNNRISAGWQVNLSRMLGRTGDWNFSVKLIERAYSVNKNLKDAYARFGLDKSRKKGLEWCIIINRNRL
jgi:tetratricopeptide (TPR) repeat protein